MSRPVYRARDLRIVDGNTPEWEGGYTVETADEEIVAGPFASKDDAKTAKRELVAGVALTRSSG